MFHSDIEFHRLFYVNSRSVYTDVVKIGLPKILSVKYIICQRPSITLILFTIGSKIYLFKCGCITRLKNKRGGDRRRVVTAI